MSLLDLPDELLSAIAKSLDVSDLCALSRASSRLNRISSDDRIWYDRLRSNIPAPTEIKAPDRRTLKQLYASHPAHWFLARHGIFYCDASPYGKVIFIKYDPRRGCIEGHALIARCGSWREVQVDLDGTIATYRSFDPLVALDLNYPIVSLPMPEVGRSHPLNAEISMQRDANQPSAKLMLSRFVQPDSVERNVPLWPSFGLEPPGGHRMRSQSPSNFRASGHKPDRLSEVSQATFRIRQLTDLHPAQRVVFSALGRALPAELVLNFAALDQNAYMPCADKPYQGLWVGDFSAHGCEFVAISQQDSTKPLPRKADKALQRWPNSNVTPFFAMLDVDEDADLDNGDEDLSTEASSRSDTTELRGRILATKLTGDPHVPRGEITFVSEDIGAKGHVGWTKQPDFNPGADLTDPDFKGARMIKSVGHIAERDFERDCYIPSQLIVCNENLLAQYWQTWKHVSFYQRVDIDKLRSSS